MYNCTIINFITTAKLDLIESFVLFFLIVCLPWWFQCLIAAECADAPNHDLVFQNYFTKHAVCAKAVSAEF